MKDFEKKTLEEAAKAAEQDDECHAYPWQLCSYPECDCADRLRDKAERYPSR